MIPVLSKEAAYALDKDTIDSGYLSENELMHNAGQFTAQFIIENIKDPFNQKFNVITGIGNNGGDAIIAHAYLREYGVSSSLFLLNENTFSTELINTYNIPADEIQIINDEMSFDSTQWFIDGIFGIGLNRDVEGEYAQLIEKLSHCSNIISIDIPSGIIANTGMEAGNAIHARYTLTMGYPKLGHFLNSGKDCSGILEVLDIGFKTESISSDNVHLIEAEDVKGLLHTPIENTHKYKQGKLLLICGSKGYAGAAILTAQGAIKTGTGIAKIVLPDSLYSIFENNVPEVITLPLPEYISGTLSAENNEQIIKQIHWSDAVVFGPGLTMDDAGNNWESQVLNNIDTPLVLDAAGFLPLVEGTLSISDLPKNCIITPHYNEFAQIFRREKGKVIADPVGMVKTIVSKLEGRVLVLKGPTTIIVSSSGEIFLNNRGSSLLATAGTGDVLSGIIGALLSQGYNIDNAAIIATWLHGECAREFSELSASKGLSASDLPYLLPAAWESILYVH